MQRGTGNASPALAPSRVVVPLSRGPNGAAWETVIEKQSNDESHPRRDGGLRGEGIGTVNDEEPIGEMISLLEVGSYHERQW